MSPLYMCLLGHMKAAGQHLEASSLCGAEQRGRPFLLRAWLSLTAPAARGWSPRCQPGLWLEKQSTVTSLKAFGECIK